MMVPIEPTNMTTVLTGSGCKDLPVIINDGVIYSYWRLSWIERIKVFFGRNIRLCVLGNMQPPVALDLEKY